jgi:peptidylprolyl isomerase
MLRSARRTGLALTALAAALLACREVNAPNEDPATTTYAVALGVDVSRMTRTPSGLYYQDLVTGQGTEADSGKTVRTYYTGWLTSGEQFDSNRGKTPFQFVLGAGTVIKGWDEGIKGMRVGGRRRIVVPPALGYGGTTNDLIPAGSVLVFDVELVSVT